MRKLVIQMFLIYLRLNTIAWFSFLVFLVPESIHAQEQNYQSLSDQIVDLDKQGNYKQATVVAVQALSLAEKSEGPEHPRVADALNNLAELYRIQGQYALAEPLFKRALSIYEKISGKESPYVATILNNLALLYSRQRHYAEAELLFKRVIAIREKTLGVNHPALAASLNNLALHYKNQARFAEAETLFKRSLAILEAHQGIEKLNIPDVLSNLGLLYQEQGKYAQSEPFYKRALEMKEKAWGLNHLKTASTLNALGKLYSLQGRYDRAEAFYQRSLSIREQFLRPEHPDVAACLSDLGLLYQERGKYVQAETLLKRALTIRENIFGAEGLSTARAMNNLALLYTKQGRYALATPLHEHALAVLEKWHGKEHIEVAASMNNLGLLYMRQGNFSEAELLLKRVVAIREKTLGTEHPKLATGLSNLASVYAAQGRLSEAMGPARRATKTFRERIVAAGVDDAASLELAVWRGHFILHLALLAQNPDKEAPEKIADESFQIAQLMQSSNTVSAIAKMAARFASGSDALAQLAKRKQDIAQQRSRSDLQLINAATLPPQQRDAEKEKRLRESLTQMDKELESVDAELARRFPEYQELTHPEPVTVAGIQSLLHPGEAILVYMLDVKSYLWVVTPEQVRFEVLQAPGSELGAKVAKIRNQMELSETGRPRKLSVDDLYSLYKDLFAPALSALSGVSHLIVVPSGALQSLPFGMLVSAPPRETNSEADYRHVQWLVRSYAYSVLPSVGSLQALRRFAKAGHAPEPFIGFGDPLIGRGSSPKGARAPLSQGTAVTGIKAAENTDIADVELIRTAQRLPETADELRSIAKSMMAGRQSVWLQEQATETRVKTMDLSRYRTLAFATHGALAGQVKGVGEPGLVLTPPAVGTADDDGYLAASEIARLSLNADWVVLSACNTAAPDGTPGAEGLSGMGKAFFYAGARSLLVSHWPVVSQATVPLTTVMLREFETNPSMGKARAQRKAILGLIDSPEHPEYAHPLYWAPFVVVGEGGSERRSK